MWPPHLQRQVLQVSVERAYYRSLADAIVRAWGNPTSPPDRIYKFLDFGLTYGPSEQWPEALLDAWVIGQQPSLDKDHHWPVDENIEQLVEHCRAYLEE